MVHSVRPRRGRRYRAFAFYKHLIPPGFLNESNYVQVFRRISNNALFCFLNVSAEQPKKYLDEKNNYYIAKK